MREIRIENAGGGFPSLKELAGAIVIASNASIAPANDQPIRFRAVLRVGGFIQIHADMNARARSVIMTATVGSEKPPMMKAMKKPSGYFQKGIESFAAADMDRKMKDARYGMKTRGAK